MAMASQGCVISDESKEILLRKIQDFVFVDSRFKLKGYSCCHCDKVAIKHCITSCDHVLCEKCYRELYTQPCPVCMTIITNNTQDEDFERVIFELKVECEFKKNGCSAIMYLGNFLDHGNKCKFATEKLLPKLYNADPNTEKLENVNAELLNIKNVMQEQNRRLKQDFLAEIKTLTDKLLEGKKKMHDANTAKQEAEIDKLTKDIDGKFGAVHTKIDRLSSSLGKSVESTLRETVITIQTLISEFSQMKAGNEILKADLLTEYIIHKDEMLADNKQLKDGMAKQQVEIANLTTAMDEKFGAVHTKIDRLSSTFGKNLESTTRETVVTNEKLLSEFNQMKAGNEILKDDLLAENKIHKDELLADNRQLQDVMAKQDVKINKLTKAIDEKFNAVHNKIDRLSSTLGKSMESTSREIAVTNEKLLSEINQMNLQNNNQFAQLGVKFHSETKAVDYDNEGKTYTSTDYNGDLEPAIFNWTVSAIKHEIDKFVKDAEYYIESDEFIIPANGLKFNAKLTKEGGFFFIFLNFTEDSRTHSPPFMHSRKYVLVDQSNANGQPTVILHDQQYFGERSAKRMTKSSLCDSIFFSRSLLKNCDQFVKNDAILIRIIVEPIALTFKHIASYDGVLLWRIDDYTKRKQDEISGLRLFLNSNAFYTSTTGYRLDGLLYLNDAYRCPTPFLTLIVNFRIGQWDFLHSGPFKYKCKCYLLDQSDAHLKRDIIKESGERVSSQHGLAICFHKFVSHADAEKRLYLKDDSLLFKIVVEIL